MKEFDKPKTELGFSALISGLLVAAFLILIYEILNMIQ